MDKEVIKKIALLTTGLVVGVAVGKKLKCKSVNQFKPIDSFLNIDAHSLSGESLLLIKNLMQHNK